MSESLNSFYLTPPPGCVCQQRKTLMESTTLAKSLVDKLTTMLTECEERFPFGLYGVTYPTIKVLQIHFIIWDCVIKRLDHFDASLANKINPYAIRTHLSS